MQVSSARVIDAVEATKATVSASAIGFMSYPLLFEPFFGFWLPARTSLEKPGGAIAASRRDPG
jgi:hypothetical protein